MNYMMMWPLVAYWKDYKHVWNAADLVLAVHVWVKIDTFIWSDELFSQLLKRGHLASIWALAFS